MNYDKLNLIRVAALAAFGLNLAPARAGEIDLRKLPPAAARPGITFEKDVRPLFESSCLRCHGEERPKAGLRLDSLEGALRGSKDGQVIVPGQSEKSLLVIAVAQLDPEKSMPPKPRAGPRGPGRPGGFGVTAESRQTPATSGQDRPPSGTPGGKGGFGPPPKPLTPEQVGVIRAWVDQGAK